MRLGKIALALGVITLFLSACSVGDTEKEGAEIGEKSEMIENTEALDEVIESALVTVAESGKKTDFLISCDTKESERFLSDVEYFRERLVALTGNKVGMLSSSSVECKDKNEILIGDIERDEVKQLRELLGRDEFAIKAYGKGDNYVVALAYSSERARMCGLMYLMNCCGEDRIELELGRAVRGEGSVDALFAYSDAELIDDRRVADNFIIYERSATMRDPNVIYHDGFYYMYGTGWTCYKADSLDGPWQRLEIIKHADLEEYGVKTASVANPWAPEIHEYNGKFYLFTTYACGAHDCDYKVKENMKGYWQVPSGHRACIVLAADSPEGPFAPISKNSDGELGHSTPSDIYTIDATLYVDREGQPWMVYSKEWMTTDAPKGSFWAAKLSDDLSTFISEPELVFEATLSPEDGSWASDGCMDGEYFYRAEDGTLYMLWSPSVDGGYSVAVAKSERGELFGPWSAESELLFSKEMGDGADGGHGSLFKDGNGQMWLAIHSPNKGAPARPTFVPIIEKDGRLCWGLIRP